MKFIPVLLASLAIVSCSSWHSPPQRTIASESSIFGSWKVEDGFHNCSETLSIEMSSDGKTIDLKLADGHQSWRMPLRKGDERTNLDRICTPATFNQSGDLARSCKGEFQTGTMTIPVNMSWNIANRNGKLIYNHVNMNTKDDCTYTRVGISSGPVIVSSDPSPEDYGTLRREPPKPSVSSGERFYYEEVGRQVIGQHKLGVKTFDLENLSSQNEKIKTIAAPMKIEIERTINPCVSINVEGRGDDPNKCTAVRFDRLEEGNSLEREILVRADTDQDSDVAFKGSLKVTLGVDNKLSYEMLNSPDNLFVGILEINQHIVVKTDVASDEVKNLGNVIKGISVSKGSLTVETTVADIQGYNFSVKVDRDKLIGKANLMNQGIDLKDSAVQTQVQNGKVILKIDVRKIITDKGGEYLTGKKHDFYVDVSAKSITKGRMGSRQIIKKPAGLSTSPVQKSLAKIKVD